MKSFLVIGMLFLGSISCLSAAEVNVLEDGIQKQEVVSMDVGLVTDLVITKTLTFTGLIVEEIVIESALGDFDSVSINLAGMLMDSRSIPAIRGPDYKEHT